MILTGLARIGKDAELRYTSNNKAALYTPKRTAP